MGYRSADNPPYTDMHEPTDHEDRLVDLALTEIVGGQTPPDLSARIAAALSADSSPQPSRSTTMNTQPSKTRWAVYAVAASIALVTGVVAVTSTVNNAFVAKETTTRGLADAEREKMPKMRITDLKARRSDLLDEQVANSPSPEVSNSLGAEDKSKLQLGMSTTHSVEGIETEQVSGGMMSQFISGKDVDAKTTELESLARSSEVAPAKPQLQAASEGTGNMYFGDAVAPAAAAPTSGDGQNAQLPTI